MEMDPIENLVMMGFSRSQAEKALKGRNLDEATEWLLTQNESEKVEEMNVEDEDYKLALQLQQEFQNSSPREQGILCQLTNKRYPGEEIYILDDCGHKFQKTALLEYVKNTIMTQVNVKCPSCPASISVRDMQELLPKKDNTISIIPNTSSKQASQRITAELKHIMNSNPEKNGYSIELVNDNLYHWQCSFFDFDKKELIAQDLKDLKHKAIVLHITFPSTYPFAPPFCRIIRPRFMFMTGHVTIGGSICTELLTNKGWSSANTVEAVVVSIRAQFLEGGARLDKNNKRDYTESEAKVAFNRMVQTHGWH
jgi:ubiquitin-conjugating enzyme E2 Q